MCLRTILDAGAFWLWHWEQRHWCGPGDAIDKNFFAYGLHLAPAQPSKRYSSTCAFTVSGSSALSTNSVRYTLGLQCMLGANSAGDIFSSECVNLLQNKAAILAHSRYRGRLSLSLSLLTCPKLDLEIFQIITD